MLKNEAIEQSKFLINRYDHYFDSINNKGVFYITINTFLLGATVSLLDKFIPYAGNWIYYLVFTFCLVNVLSTILTILAINPFKSSTQDEPSLIYYYQISNQDLVSFKKAFADQSEELLVNDFASQIYQLANGLRVKFNRLYIAGILLLTQFILLLPIVTITILNIKK